MPGLREMILLKETAAAATPSTIAETENNVEEECPQLVEMKSADVANEKGVVDDKYFTSYDSVEVHRLMIQDKARTDAYRDAILKNPQYFQDKTVMDVGAGTGILSLFAKQAGAKKVYAVEASPLVDVLREIVKLNDEEGVIEVVHGKAEEVELETKVDIIVSEWMGFYLLHESMLDSVIAARDKHLHDDGLMFPSHARIMSAPVQLDQWVSQQLSGWDQVYGFNMTPMAQRAVELMMARGAPEVMQLSETNMLSEPISVGDTLDLRWVQREEIVLIKDRKFVSISKTGNLHGLAIWFDVIFEPTFFEDEFDTAFTRVELATGPMNPETHWKQTVLVIVDNLGAGEVEEDEVVGWDLSMAQSESNSRQYSLSLELLDPETDEHPAPCHCHLAKCELVAALMEKEDREMEELEEIINS